jgi:hypothetical protein
MRGVLEIDAKDSMSKSSQRRMILVLPSFSIAALFSRQV